MDVNTVVNFSYVDHRTKQLVGGNQIFTGGMERLPSLDALASHIERFVATVPLGEYGTIVCLFPESQKPAITLDLDARTVFPTNSLEKRPMDDVARRNVQYVVLDGSYENGDLEEEIEGDAAGGGFEMCHDGWVLNSSVILERGVFSDYDSGVVRYDLVVPHREDHVSPTGWTRKDTPFERRISRVVNQRFDQYALQMKAEESTKKKVWMLRAVGVIFTGLMLNAVVR